MIEERRATPCVLGTGGHLPALDGMRGVAILLVLICHSVLYGGIDARTFFDHAFVRLALSGWVGVDLFFVLSGFLITGILCDTQGGAHYFRNFYARRVLRIFPLYYGFLALLFLGIPVLVEAGLPFRVPSQEGIWYWTYLVNVRIAFAG